MTKTIWNIDPTHSDVLFKVKHLVINTVTGRFKNFSGSVTAEGEDLSNAIAKFQAEVASIDTNQEQRDAHLRSDDFFNAEAYPTIDFKSTAITKSGENTYKMDGELTIRNITKAITLQVNYLGATKDPWGQFKAGYEITGSINRKDFDLKWDALTEAGGLVAGHEVKFDLSIQLVRQEVATA